MVRVSKPHMGWYAKTSVCLALLAFVGGCSQHDTSADGRAQPDAAGATTPVDEQNDSGSAGDASAEAPEAHDAADTSVDAGTRTDAGPTDAGSTTPRDSGQGSADSGPDPDQDSGSERDVTTDAARDAGTDAPWDGGHADAADLDAAEPDASVIDATVADAAEDATVSTDAGGAEDSGGEDGLSTECQKILIDNDGLPVQYPVLYYQSQAALERFESEKARLISTYGLENSHYDISAAPITSVGSIDSQGDISLRLGDTPIDESSTLTIAEAFLSEWGSLFGYEGTTYTHDEPYCSGNFCRVDLTQQICGLPIYSPETDYGGGLYVYFQSVVRGVNRILSGFIPVVRLPRHPLIGADEAVSAVIGQTVSWDCADGEHSTQVSAADEITVEERPTVYVRTSPSLEAALEYRMAMTVNVALAGPGWIIYVDGLDGSVLEALPQAICD